jgi:hypothetical protein
MTVIMRHATCTYTPFPVEARPQLGTTYSRQAWLNMCICTCELDEVPSMEQVAPNHAAKNCMVEVSMV